MEHCRTQNTLVTRTKTKYIHALKFFDRMNASNSIRRYRDDPSLYPIIYLPFKTMGYTSKLYWYKVYCYLEGSTNEQANFASFDSAWRDWVTVAFPDEYKTNSILVFTNNVLLELFGNKHITR